VPARDGLTAGTGDVLSEGVADPAAGGETVARVPPALPQPAAANPSAISNGTAHDLIYDLLASPSG
jgi:hypothetical protein